MSEEHAELGACRLRRPLPHWLPQTADTHRRQHFHLPAGSKPSPADCTCPRALRPGSLPSTPIGGPESGDRVSGKAIHGKRTGKQSRQAQSLVLGDIGHIQEAAECIEADSVRVVVGAMDKDALSREACVLQEEP